LTPQEVTSELVGKGPELTVPVLTARRSCLPVHRPPTLL
jgi:hypothetical protein